MKIAVTAQSPEMTSAVDPRFGRARYFVVMDTDSGEVSVHDNAQNLNAVQGAGIQAAQNVANLNVDAVVTGNVGPKAFAALQAAEVKAFTGATGSLSDAIKQVMDGRLECASEANVEGHWT